MVISRKVNIGESLHLCDMCKDRKSEVVVVMLERREGDVGRIETGHEV
jgi:hypothetical protein